MSGPLREAGLWSGAAVLALAGHVAAGAWLMQVEPRPGEGSGAPMPVEIIMEAPPDIPPDVPSQAVAEVVPPPVPDAVPELTPVQDEAPVTPPMELPAPELAEAPPSYEPPPPPPPVLPQEVIAPVMVREPPPEPLELALAPAPPPDAVLLPMPAPLDMTPPDLAEALPEIQPPPEPEPVPEPEEEISDSAVALALRPPARPERPAPPAPEPPRPASAPAPAPQAPAAPAAAAAPAPVAPSRGEIQSWQSQVQRSIARHMQRARLPAGRGQVQANLSISVAVNGAASARLIASTGNPDVDAALQRQAASLPALPPPPGGQGVTLNLPVVVAYR